MGRSRTPEQGKASSGTDLFKLKLSKGVFYACATADERINLLPAKQGRADESKRRKTTENPQRRLAMRLIAAYKAQTSKAPPSLRMFEPPALLV